MTTDRIPLDEMTSDHLDALYARAERAETEASRYAEAESADAAAGSYARRAEQAEAAIERAREECHHIRSASVLADGAAHTGRERGAVSAVERILAALGEQPGPAATEATGPDGT